MIQNIIKLHPKSLILLIRKKKTKIGTRTDLKAASRYIGSKEEDNQEQDIAAEETMDENECAKYDQFDENEEDAYKTRAEFSCLWELYSLKQHFCFKIRSIVSKFESNFLKSKESDFDEITGVDEDDLMYDISSAKFYLPSVIDSENIYKKLNY
jgi:hypothetical protein